MFDFIPDEVIRANVIIGGGVVIGDGKAEVLTTLFLGGSQKGIQLPKEVDLGDWVRDFPLFGFLLKRLPHLNPEEFVEVDIAIGDRNMNGKVDVGVKLLLNGDPDPKFDHLRDLEFEDAFELFSMLLRFIGEQVD